MGSFTRAALITGIALFLEGFGVYLASRLLANAIRLPDAAIPLGIAALGIGWAFLLSWYVQTIRFSLNLRGVIGLILSAVSVLALAAASVGAGWFPVGAVFAGDLRLAAALGLATVFMLTLWWRGASIARDDVTMDVVRNAFVRGVAIVIAAVAVDTIMDAAIIRLPGLLLFFAIGLSGLALSRFAAEGGAAGRMNRGWLLAIGGGVGGVLLLALILAAAGVGGLDDAARAVMSGISFLGLWILRPLLLLLGLLAAGLVAVGNWVSGIFGGGDLSGLELARLQIEEFHESLREVEGGQPPGTILTALKWLAFLLAVALAGWILFRMFRRRRLDGGNYAADEVRESTFTWQDAGQDVADALSGLLNAAAGRRRRPRPANPRAAYHRMLDIAASMGFPRRPSQTPREHRADVRHTLPAPPVARIVNAFQRYYYGGQSQGDDAETMSSLLDDLNDLEPRR